MVARVPILLPLLCGLAAAGCSDDSTHELKVDVPTSITVTSTAFSEGGDIPVRFTCDGAATSPPLNWASKSDEPRSWALVVDDPDAPGDTYVHWVVLDIPSTTRAIASAATPAGAVEADNSAGGTGYTAPCPPSGSHRYRFTVYALKAPTGLEDGASLDSALEAIRSGAVSRGTLQATYERGS